MYNDMDVLILCFVWVKVLVPIYICVNEYGERFLDFVLLQVWPNEWLEG